MSSHHRVIGLLRELTARTERWVEVRGTRAGVHRTHLHALGHLVDAESAGTALSPGDLSSALNLSAPATTALVDKLVAAGHVDRSPHEADRRRTVLTTTDAARATGGQVFGPLAVRLIAVTESFSEEELEVVARFLEAANAVIDPDD